MCTVSQLAIGAPGEEGGDAALDDLADLQEAPALVAIGGGTGEEDEERGRQELGEADHAESEGAVRHRVDLPAERDGGDLHGEARGDPRREVEQEGPVIEEPGLAFGRAHGTRSACRTSAASRAVSGRRPASDARSRAATTASAAADERSMRLTQPVDQPRRHRDLAVGEELDEQRREQRVVGRVELGDGRRAEPAGEIGKPDRPARRRPRARLPSGFRRRRRDGCRGGRASPRRRAGSPAAAQGDRRPRPPPPPRPGSPARSSAAEVAEAEDARARPRRPDVGEMGLARAGGAGHRQPPAPATPASCRRARGRAGWPARRRRPRARGPDASAGRGPVAPGGSRPASSGGTPAGVHRTREILVDEEAPDHPERRRDRHRHEQPGEAEERAEDRRARGSARPDAARPTCR